MPSPSDKAERIKMVKPQMEEAPVLSLKKQQCTLKPAKHVYSGIDLEISARLASSSYIYITFNNLLTAGAQTLGKQSLWVLREIHSKKRRKKKIHYCSSRQEYPLD